MRKKNLPLIINTGDITEPATQFSYKECSRNTLMKPVKNLKQSSYKEVGDNARFLTEQTNKALAEIHGENYDLDDYDQLFAEVSDTEDEDYEPPQQLADAMKMTKINYDLYVAKRQQQREQLGVKLSRGMEFFKAERFVLDTDMNASPLQTPRLLNLPYDADTTDDSSSVYSSSEWSDPSSPTP